MASGGPSREVTIRFNADFAPARKEMAAFAKDQKKFNEDQWKAEKGRAEESEKAVGRKSAAERTAAKESAKAFKETERAEKQRYADQERMDRKQYASRMKAIADRQKAEERAAREAERAEAKKYAEIARLDQRQYAARLKTIRDRERAETESSRRVEQAQRTYQVRERRAQMAERRFERSLERGVTQFAGMGKNLLMLGGMEEQDTEKMLRNLVKIQLVYETILGAKEGVEMLVRSWRAYSYSVKLAAEAHAALALAQAASGATGAASAGSTAAGAAGAAGAGWGGKIWGGAKWLIGGAMAKISGGVGMAGRIASNPYAIIAAGAASYADLGIGAFQNRNNGPGFLNYFDASKNAGFRPTRWGSLLGEGTGNIGNYLGFWGNTTRYDPVTGKPRRSAESREQYNEAERERIARMQSTSFRDYAFARDDRGLYAEARMERGRYASLAVNVDELTGGNKLARENVARRNLRQEELSLADVTRQREAAKEANRSQEEILGLLKEEEEALGRMKTRALELAEAKREVLEVEKQTAQAAKETASAEYDRATADRDSAEGRNISGADAWNAAGPSMQRRFVQIKKQLQEGLPLTRAQEKIYPQSGLDQFPDLRAAHNKQTLSKANEAGWGEYAGNELWREQKFSELQRQDADRRMTQQHKIVIEIEQKQRAGYAMVEKIIAEVVRMIQQRHDTGKGVILDHTDDKTSGAGKNKAMGYDFGGRMTALAGQV